MCESAWNQYEIPQMNLHSVCITCGFILSSESSSFTSFPQVPVLPAALHSWLLWGKLMVSVPGKGSWALQREKKFIWTCCWTILSLSWGYHLPLLFLFWKSIFSALLFLSSKRKYLLECCLVCWVFCFFFSLEAPNVMELLLCNINWNKEKCLPGSAWPSKPS